jgi:hypothetical protein
MISASSTFYFYFDGRDLEGSGVGKIVSIYCGDQK